MLTISVIQAEVGGFIVSDVYSGLLKPCSPGLSS